jgi:hypothetical protein
MSISVQEVSRTPNRLDQIELPQQYMTTSSPLQKILQEILHTENEANKTRKGKAVPNHMRGKGKKVESNIDSAAQIKPLNNKTSK